MRWKGLQRGIARLDALVFSTRCRLCGATSGIEDNLCGGCLADLPWLVGGCPACARALPDGHTAAPCGACLRKPPAFDAATALLRYRKPVDYLIQQLKFSGELALAPLLARRLAEKVAERSNSLPELLIPVPLHPARLRERGSSSASSTVSPPLSMACIASGSIPSPSASIKGKYILNVVPLSASLYTLINSPCCLTIP